MRFSAFRVLALPWLLVGLLFVSASSARAAERTSSAEEWREDLRHLVAEIPKLHPDAFFSTPRAEFESAAAALAEKIPQLSDNQIRVGVMELVARTDQPSREALRHRGEVHLLGN